jgi:hypothetical protein
MAGVSSDMAVHNMDISRKDLSTAISEETPAMVLLSTHSLSFLDYLEGHGTSSESKKDSEWVLNSTMAGVSSDMAVDKQLSCISAFELSIC